MDARRGDRASGAAERRRNRRTPTRAGHRPGPLTPTRVRRDRTSQPAHAERGASASVGCRARWTFGSLVPSRSSMATSVWTSAPQSRARCSRPARACQRGVSGGPPHRCTVGRRATRDARKALQVDVSQLRKVIGKDGCRRSRPGTGCGWQERASTSIVFSVWPRSNPGRRSRTGGGSRSPSSRLTVSRSQRSPGSRSSTSPASSGALTATSTVDCTRCCGGARTTRASPSTA